MVIVAAAGAHSHSARADGPILDIPDRKTGFLPQLHHFVRSHARELDQIRGWR